MATPTRPPAPKFSVATRIAMGAGVAAATLAGMWFVAAVLAPTYVTSIAFAVVWFLLASFLVGRLWKRFPELKWAARGSFLATALIASAVFAWTSLRTTEAHDKIPESIPASKAEAAPKGGGGKAPAGNVEEASGEFISISHGTSKGRASIIRLENGDRKLAFRGFSTPNGPDLRVYLVPGDGNDASDNHDLGGLKGNRGEQLYDIPKKVDTEKYRNVLIWCRAFSVGFTRAPMEAS
jgi:hypothetical protein